MFITTSNDGVEAVISPWGEIDFAAVPALLAAVRDLPLSVTRVTWDLRKILFMDSAGLHLFDDHRSACLGTGRTLTVTGLRPQPLELLRLAHELSPEHRWSDFLPEGSPTAAA
ncbi:STAS domain-containing protein [Streptomyces sp. NPDC057302]|uniref:STAS domain-containing protein n=1 Tax=Streptomyces sp. NPDC057302 TaxID=3346094 RepID=UPI00362D7409